MIIITLHNFSPDFSNTRFNHQEQSWSPPCVILLKVKLSSAPLPAYQLHVLSRTGHT